MLSQQRGEMDLNHLLWFENFSLKHKTYLVRRFKSSSFIIWDIFAGKISNQKPVWTKVSNEAFFTTLKTPYYSYIEHELIKNIESVPYFAAVES